MSQRSIAAYTTIRPYDSTPFRSHARSYHCAIDKDLFAKKIQQAKTCADDMSDMWITVPITHFLDHNRELRAIGFTQHSADEDRMRGPATKTAITHFKQHKITHDRERFESTTATEIRLRVEAVNRWYAHDWNTLDNKIRSSIVEGVSVFLSMFDLPAVARVFCPPAPAARPNRGRPTRTATNCPRSPALP